MERTTLSFVIAVLIMHVPRVDLILRIVIIFGLVPRFYLSFPLFYERTIRYYILSVKIIDMKNLKVSIENMMPKVFVLSQTNLAKI